MVQFGRHMLYLRERLESGVYLVEYKAICETIGDSTKFRARWEAALGKACEQHGDLSLEIWSTVFAYGGDDDGEDGARPADALKRYGAAKGGPAVRRLADRCVELRTAAKANREALRKLVKKHDKAGGGEKLARELLPKLYSSSMADTDAALDSLAEGVRNQPETETPRPMLGYSESFADRSLRRASSWLGSAFFGRAEETRVGRRAGEVAWLRDLVACLPPRLIPHLVAHRGFHSTKDRTDTRPLENSLEAYELAWTSGAHHCECDVAVTADGALVLCHDADYGRLALAVPGGEGKRALRVGELTLSELMAMPLKTGSRPSLLEEVLRSAARIGSDAKLVIEVKPGNTTASAALLALFEREPDLAARVAVVMSFDAFIMHAMAAALASAPARPRLLLLTVSEAQPDGDDLWTILDVDGDTAPALKIAAGLDGVYCQYQPSMLTGAGAARTRALTAAGRVLGVWGYADRDPDDVKTAMSLVVDCGATFVNTDLPATFVAAPSSPPSTAPASPVAQDDTGDGNWGYFDANDSPATAESPPRRAPSLLAGFDGLLWK